MLQYISTDRKELSNFITIGVLGNAVGWLFYAAIFHLLPFDNFKPTISWIISFHFGVLIQHFLHRRFTFQDSEHPYLSSLIKTYISYIGILFFGLIVNLSLNELLKIYHHFSWFLTLAASIPASFVILKKFAFNEEKKDSGGK